MERETGLCYSIVQEENFYEIARGGLKGYDTRWKECVNKISEN